MQTKLKMSDKELINKHESLRLNNQIKSGNFRAVEETMNRICRVITKEDQLMNDEFLKSVVSEVYGEFGGDQLIAAERGYPIDFKSHEPSTMDVTTACGKKIKVNSVQCNMPYSSEVFKQYYDYLLVNKKKTLPVTISTDEIRNLACGENTYGEIYKLVVRKITESIEAYIRDEIYCIINNPVNYKEIVDLTYICDDECERETFIEALTKFALNLQINTEKYNLAGRIYDLPLKTEAWLLNSTNLAAKLATQYAKGGTNASYIDISSKFARTFDIPQLRMADGIIMDKNWLQVRKVFTELVWKYEPAVRAECGVYNLDMKIKPVNFFVAVPFKLYPLKKAEVDKADVLKDKIENGQDLLEFDFDETASDPIKDVLTKFEEKAKAYSKDTDFTLSFEHEDFQKTPDEKQSTLVIHTIISNKKGVKITAAYNNIRLRHKT